MSKFCYKDMYSNDRKNITQILRMLDIEYTIIYSGNKPIGTDISSHHILKAIELIKDREHYGTKNRVKYLKGLL